MELLIIASSILLILILLNWSRINEKRQLEKDKVQFHERLNKTLCNIESK